MEAGKKVVIGIDPGIKNLGWCVTDLKGKIVKSGLVTETITDLKRPEFIGSFRKNMKGLISTLNQFSSDGYRPDFIMERYMPRGMRRGNQTEMINILIGYLMAKVKYNNLYLIPASTWKNRREHYYLHVDNETIPEHITDTYTMTLFYLERLIGIIDLSMVKKRLKRINKTTYNWVKKKGVWMKN